MTRLPAEDFEFEHEGLTLRGKWWPGQGRPVLALHGWLDNAASFDALANAMPERSILALDLYGHGHSDHKPPSGSYGIWEDLRGLDALCRHLDVKDITLMGHSRGAIIATLLAAARPEYVNALICLDGFIAEPVGEHEALGQLSQYLRDYSQTPRPTGAGVSLTALVKARRRGTDISEAAATTLLKRNTRVDEAGRRYWRSDRRLAWASPLKLTQGQWQAVVDALSMPVLIVYASRGVARRSKGLLSLANNIDTVEIEGGHHCHMEDAGAERIGAELKSWEDLQTQGP